jgi:hypothetical protein
MKLRPIFEYVYFRYGLVNENIGFRYDEAHRAYKLVEKPLSVIELMNLFGEVEEVTKYIKKKYRKVESMISDYPISQNIFGDRQHNRLDIHWANKQYPMIDDRVEHKAIIDFWKYTHPEFDFPDDSNCQGCHHKDKRQIKRNYIANPDILTWFAMQEKKGKYNTWHDDIVPYERIFQMSFEELMEFDSGSSCDTGYCTD